MKIKSRCGSIQLQAQVNNNTIKELEMENRFTAYPWTIDIQQTGIKIVTSKWFKTDKGTQRLTVCRVENPLIPETEIGSNAKIIAAAPQCYEIIKRLLEPNNRNDDIETRKQASLLIAKIDGSILEWKS